MKAIAAKLSLSKLLKEVKANDAKDAKAPDLAAKFVNTVQYGHGDGKTFDDLSARPVDVRKWPITRIALRCGSLIDNIEVLYGGPGALPSFSHGGSGGGPAFFDVPSDDPIVGVDLRCGRKVDSLQFVLRSGKRSQKFGGSGGDPHHISGGGRPLAYIFGHTDGHYVTSIGFAFQAQILPAFTSEMFGKGAGAPFDDLPCIPEDVLLHPITRIDVTTNNHPLLESIRFWYSGAIAPDAHGGSSGNHGSFSLDPDTEFIQAVNVRCGTVVDGIQFVTNTGRTSMWFGGRGGGPQQDSHGVLLGVAGAIGNWKDHHNLVTGLKFYWASSLAIDYSDFEFTIPAGGFGESPASVGQIGPLTNASTAPETLSASFSWTEAHSTTVTVSDSWKIGTSVSLKFPSILGLIDTALAVSFDYTHQTAEAISAQSSVQQTTNFSVTVPPKSTMSAQIVVFSKSCVNVPFTAKKYQVIQQANGDPIRVFLKTVSGTFTGTSAFRVEAKWGNPTPIDN